MPLTATALVLSAASENIAGVSGGSPMLALIAVDHCLLWPKEMAELLGRISTAAGVDRDRLLVMFSHTHGAGLMGLERTGLPGGELIAPYLEELSARLAGAVLEAIGTLQAVTVTYGTGHCGLARHRDLWDAASGQWVCGFNPDGPADDTLMVARFADFHGQTVATVVNYACHPTTLAWENTLISPDYVGACRQCFSSKGHRATWGRAMASSATQPWPIPTDGNWHMRRWPCWNRCRPRARDSNTWDRSFQAQ
jgi:hypothetical protein